MVRIDQVLGQLATQESIELDKFRRLNFLVQEYNNIAFSLVKWVIKYCDAKNIPIWDETKFANLIEDTDRILSEIDRTVKTFDGLSKHASDEFLQGDSSDADYTEPGGSHAHEMYCRFGVIIYACVIFHSHRIQGIISLNVYQ
jgi:hypothetical protein